MKTNFLIFVLSGVVAVAVGAYILFGPTDQGAETTITEMTTQETLPESNDEEPMTGRSSIASLMMQGGGSMECTFRFSDSETYSEGTGFFADGNVRVDALGYSATAEQYVSNFIMSDESVYIWGETEQGSFAVKMPASHTTANQGANEQFSVEETVDYDCRRWTPDNSVFVPPATIEFMDMTDMSSFMEGMMEAYGGN